MSTQMLEHVIFSFDNTDKLREYARALRALDELRAMGKISEPHMCIGSYEDRLEPSFMVPINDWYVIREKLWGYLLNQECVLHVPGDSRNSCSLRTLSGDFMETLDPMKYEMCLPDQPSWTYLLGDDSYWTCED